MFLDELLFLLPLDEIRIPGFFVVEQCSGCKQLRLFDCREQSRAEFPWIELSKMEASGAGRIVLNSLSLSRGRFRPLFLSTLFRLLRFNCVILITQDLDASGITILNFATKI